MTSFPLSLEELRTVLATLYVAPPTPSRLETLLALPGIDLPINLAEFARIVSFLPAL